MPRLVRLKSMKDFKAMQRKVAPATLEDLAKAYINLLNMVTKLEEKVHGLEMMVIRTRARFIVKEMRKRG